MEKQQQINKFENWLVVTKDGKIGNMMFRLFSDGKYLTFTDIPNEESEHTAYYDEEIDLVYKPDIENLNNK